MNENDAYFGHDVNTVELNPEDLQLYLKNLSDEWMQANATLMTREQKKMPGMLDRRALDGDVFYSDDFIAVSGKTKHIEYYGGFEYIDDNSKTVVGGYTMYMAENEPRVKKLLNILNDVHEEHEEEDEE